MEKDYSVELLKLQREVLHNLWKDKKCHDVVITCKDGVSTTSSSLLFVIASKYMEKLFTENRREFGFGFGEDFHLILHDFEITIVLYCLEFIATGKVTVSNPEVDRLTDLIVRLRIKSHSDIHKDEGGGLTNGANIKEEPTEDEDNPENGGIYHNIPFEECLNEGDESFKLEDDDDDDDGGGSDDPTTTDPDMEIPKPRAKRRKTKPSKLRKTKSSENSDGEKKTFPFQCEKCFKRFARDFTFEAHMRAHDGVPKPWICDKCGKCFRRCSNLREHKRSHEGKPFVACEYCGKMFRDSSLPAHVKLLHLKTEKTLECEYCHKWFKTKLGLKTHLLIHKETKDAICDICGFATKSELRLQSHRMVHVKDKKYKCSQCDKAYHLRHQYDLHMRTHTGERPFGCDICGCRFYIKSALQNHMAGRHLNIRNYECTICSNRYKSISRTKLHIVTHTNFEPFGCSICEITFKHKETARRHIKSQHGGTAKLTTKIIPELVDLCAKSIIRHRDNSAKAYPLPPPTAPQPPEIGQSSS